MGNCPKKSFAYRLQAAAKCGVLFGTDPPYPGLVPGFSCNAPVELRESVLTHFLYWLTEFICLVLFSGWLEFVGCRSANCAGPAWVMPFLVHDLQVLTDMS